MMDPSYFLEYGHFVGKTGDHINAKLRKERLFDNPELLEVAVSALTRMVSEARPSLIVSQETHGALLARQVGALAGIPTLSYSKDGSISALNNETCNLGGSVVIIEDNIITGDSIRELIALTESVGGSIEGVMSVFSSSSNRTTPNLHHQSLIYLPITSRKPEECSSCESQYVKK